MPPVKNVLCTGVTSGIGLTVSDQVARALHMNYDVHICITCRSMTKGQSLKQKLEKYPVKVTLVEMNVESVKSVVRACEEVKKRFTSIDIIFLNAGIMPTHGIEWKYLFKTFFSTKVIEMFRTGQGLFKTKTYIIDEGVNNVFATNVLGHFVLVQQMLPLLKRNPGIKDQEPARLIWTSSTNASRVNFNENDLPCDNGDNAYGNSKFIMESVSYELNKRYNKDGIFSYAWNPGTVITNITGAMLSTWVWYLVYPIIWLARILIPNLTLTSKNASYSFVWVMTEPTQQLDSTNRFNSCTTIWNKNYVHEEKIDADDAKFIYNKLLSMSDNMVARTAASNASMVTVQQ